MEPDKLSHNSYPSNDFANNSVNLSFPLNQKKEKRNNFFKKTAGKKSKKFFKIFFIIIFFLGAFLLSRGFFKNLLSSYQSKQSGKQAVKGEESIKSQTLTLDKNFEFPGLDDTGKKKDKIGLKISQVEKTNQVIVQEKNYTAKNNKAFLIVNLELKNETTKRLNIFPGDLIRLVVDGQEEKKFAPDLHNNYVQVAPISTKIDRLGFVIDENTKDLKLQVGELDEEKETLEINF